MVVHTITYANHTNNQGYTNFVNSMRKHNQEYRIVGGGDKWDGFITKMLGCLRALEGYPDNDIVAIIDCFDVMATNGPHDKLEARFLRFNKPIVFGVESRAFLFSSNGIKLTKWWNKSKSAFGRNKDNCSVNGGTVMGYVYALKHMLDHSIREGFTDDQLAYHHYTEKYPEKIGLDLGSTIFGNYPLLDWFRFCKHQGKILDTKSLHYPCFVHIPGSSGDFNCRMNYIGKSVLGNQYIDTPISEVCITAWKKIQSPSNRKAVLIVVGLIFCVAVVLYLLCKGRR